MATPDSNFQTLASSLYYDYGVLLQVTQQRNNIEQPLLTPLPRAQPEDGAREFPG